MTGQFTFEPGDTRDAPDFNIFFREYAAPVDCALDDEDAIADARARRLHGLLDNVPPLVETDVEPAAARAEVVALLHAVAHPDAHQRSASTAPPRLRGHRSGDTGEAA